MKAYSRPLNRLAWYCVQQLTVGDDKTNAGAAHRVIKIKFTLPPDSN